jgi:hypothetical protein
MKDQKKLKTTCVAIANIANIQVKTLAIYVDLLLHIQMKHLQHTSETDETFGTYT